MVPDVQPQENDRWKEAFKKYQDRRVVFFNGTWIYTDKKENKIFLIYKEIQMGSGAKSYVRKGYLIYEEMHKYFHHIWGGR